jgi:hypothetical protein
MKGMRLFYRQSDFDDFLPVEVLSEPYQVISSYQNKVRGQTFTETAGRTCVMCKSEHSDLMVDTPVEYLSLKGKS